MSRTHLEADKSAYETTINEQIRFITMVHNKYKELDNIYIESALEKIVT